MIMINDEIDRIKYYFEKKEKIHILKQNREFLNGIIIELCDKYLIIDDQVKGKQLVLFSEIKKPIERYIQK